MTIKSILFRTLALCILVLVAIYLLLPWWLPAAINGIVSSPNWRINDMSIGYPSPEGVTINALTIDLLANKQSVGQLNLKQAQLTINWTTRTIKAIEVESVSGDWLIPLPNKARSSQTQNGQTQINHTLNSQEVASLPEKLPTLTIEQFDFTLPFPNMPVTLSGRIEMEKPNHQLFAEIDSDESMTGKLTATLTPEKALKANLTGKAQLEEIDTLIKRLLPDLNLTLTQPQGEITATIIANLSLQDFNELKPQIAISMSPQSMGAELPLFKISKLNGRINLSYRDQLWYLNPGDLTGEIITTEAVSPLKPQAFLFNARNKAAQFDQDILLDIALKRDADRINLSLQGQLNDQFNANIDAKLTNVETYFDENLERLMLTINPNLTNWQTKSLDYQGALIFSKTLESYQVVTSNEQKFQLQGVHLGPLKDSNLDLTFNLAPESDLSKPVLTSAKVFIEQGTLSFDETNRIQLNNSQLTYQGDESSGTWQSQFNDIRLLQPNNGDWLQGKIQTAGSIDWVNQSYQGTATPNFSLKASQSVLTNLFPAQKHLWQRFSVTGDATQDQLALNGHFEIDGSFEQAPQVHGKLEANIAEIRLADNGLNQANWQLQWHGDWRDITTHLKAAQLVLKQQPQGELTGLRADIRLDESIQWRDLHLDTALFGGKLSVAGSDGWQAIDTNQGTATLEKIDLSKLSDYLGKAELIISGLLSGAIPFTLTNGQLTFGEGQLTAEQGRIAYLPQGKKIALTQETIGELANITLQNFHYQLMNAKINHGGPCGFDIVFRLEGKNPDLGARADQILNIGYQPTSNVNLYYLLLFGEDFVQELQNQQKDSVCVQPNP
ncbi:hypothetical protein FLL45_04430 [Aliikangiella marina]|uniref:Uncharacterized protein n=1 Tax=Aliikangiella marina TaxID=1712262 RepID=A0A545TIZ0_9GAMM|nr:YdbH domain-containing protein [Aliikangiella marina]TQV77199.1 hypothetical protein FLL45_04430 [Aliikangiella marina]